MRLCFALALAACLLVPHMVSAQASSTIKGKVLAISVDDPTDSRDLSRDEKRYVVRVELSTSKNLTLGFGEKGKPVEPLMAMMEVLLRAMENNWTVSLRLSRDVTRSSSASYARILSVTVER